MARRGKYEHDQTSAKRVVPGRPNLDARERFERLSIETLRVEFLCAVNELEPAVLKELRGIQLFERDDSGCHSRPGGLKTVTRWAKKWRLSDTWCIATAIRTLEYWRDNPPGEALEWFFPELEAPPFEVEEFRTELHIGSYDPTRCNPSDFIRRFDSQIEAARQQLRAYINDADKKAEAAGLLRVPEKRRALHFRWLAGFQVRRWSGRRIAEASDMESERTALHAIKILATQIGLTLRDDRDYDPAQDVGTIRRALEIPPANTQPTP